jgi:hypothetical protein
MLIDVPIRHFEVDFEDHPRFAGRPIRSSAEKQNVDIYFERIGVISLPGTDG